MELKEYFLNPGELIFSKKPIIIKTVLGSCVAVCLYDKINHFGGMCHYLLPDSTSENNIRSTKFGDIAIQTMINKFLQAGSQISQLEASVIGGAFIIFDDREIFFIGDKNADMANAMLRKHNIRIKTTNIGGEQGKRVLFNTGTNQMIVEIIREITVDDLYNRR